MPRLIAYIFCKEAPLPLTPPLMPPKREAPLPLIFMSDAPLLFVLFDVEAFEKDGYFPNDLYLYYGYIGY